MLQGQIRFETNSTPFLPTLKPQTFNSQTNNQVQQTTQLDGHQEAEKEFIKKTDQDKKKLDSLLDKSTQNLMSLTSVFPFDFFPDQITIDINKVNIIFNYFYLSRHVHSVYIKDITDIMVETGPFFAVLKIIDRGFTENSIDIKWLVKDQALRARRIIQGLVVAHKEGLDLAQFDTAELSVKLEELGRTHRS